MSPIHVSVLGGGAFGTAISHLLATNGHIVTLWCYEQEVVSQINNDHENIKYLSGVDLPINIIATENLLQSLKNDVIFEAIPVKFFRRTLLKAKTLMEESNQNQHKTWVVLSKGIENGTFLFPSEIIEEVFGSIIEIVVLGGPSFAREIVDKEITGVVVAIKEPKKNILIQDPTLLKAKRQEKKEKFQSTKELLNRLMKNSYFFLNFSTNVYDVQVGGALKNIVALSIGLATASISKNRFPDTYNNIDFTLSMNTKVLLLIQGLKEMKKFSEVFGKKYLKDGEWEEESKNLLNKGNHCVCDETLYGLSGVGDLILTATGDLSKNFQFGKSWLSHNQTINSDQLKQSSDPLPEGVNTVDSVIQMIKKKLQETDPNILPEDLSFPLMETVYEVLYEGKSFLRIFERISQTGL